jgi:long-chain acyl-CoA synthetase
LKKFIFLTGSTGFLGTQIARKLIKMDNIVLILLVRGIDYQDAHRHISRAWWEFPELLDELRTANKSVNPKILIFNGDITEDNLDLKDENYNYLVNNLTHIVHAAADLRLHASMEELRRINVHGTANIIKMAVDANKNHGIERFSHISTAYVAGCSKGKIEEDVLTDSNGFKSNYERSKYEGEYEVKNSGLPFTIFRPGMIVGDSSTGYIKTFNTIYVLLRLYLKGQLRLVPASRNLKINLVPVDYVADAVSILTFNSNTNGMTFHLTAPSNSLPTAGELVEFAHEWTIKNLGYKQPTPIFIPGSLSSTIQKLLSNGSKGIGKAVSELSPYLEEDREFGLKNTEIFIGPYQLQWKEYLGELMKFAVYYGFFHRSERTVHEQILYRLNSKNWPVSCFDVVDGEYLELKPSEIKKQIYKTINSLKSIGIKQGDRVAIAGFNSSRYLILDVAIGLIGAISVPIYYTSPVNEINEILEDSGSSAIFLGTQDLIDNSEEIETNSPIISFYTGSVKNSSVLAWDAFLELVYMNQPVTGNLEMSAPVDFNDVATIRYTSGTTGKPAGVKFTHGNLRWMAEFIASMPPWKDRTHNISYLSFLPMNHVVEGILGTYSPYYAPASLELYFLQNFQDLENTLPKVRPSIFFSVPRFYEKLWSKIQNNWLGNVPKHQQRSLKRHVG